MSTKTATKRSHFVPATYLRAWANEDDQVAVRRRDRTKIHTPNVINVAVKTGLYGRGAAGQTREEIFGKLEEIWPELREALITHGGRVDSAIRNQVALFAAIQLIRTRSRLAQAEFLNSFASFSKHRPVEKEHIRAFLAERWLRFPPSDAEVEGAWILACVGLNEGSPPNKDEVMHMLHNIATRELAPRLAKYHWIVEHCRKRMLFTSDRPVMYWRPRSPRDNYEGVGLETANETRMPLTPHDLLIIRPIGLDGGIEVVQPKRFEKVNDDIASQCHEFVIATPHCINKLERLPFAKHHPILRFNVAPGVRSLPHGGTEPMGDIMHMWIPLRADRI